MLRRKTFNVTGTCDPKLHFTVPFTDTTIVNKFKTEPGSFICLYSHKQGAKSTRLTQLQEQLSVEFTPVYVDLIGLANDLRLVSSFYKSLARLISLGFLQYNVNISFEAIANSMDFQDIFRVNSSIGKHIMKTHKPLILLIDEMDRLPEVFLDAFWAPISFLLCKQKNNPSPFVLHGCVGAGVHRIKRITLANSSSLNKNLHLKSKHFTKEECDTFLWDAFQGEYGVVLSPDIRELIFASTEGHPGLTCLVGKSILELTQNLGSHQVSMVDLVYIITKIITEGASEAPLNGLKNSLTETFNGVMLKDFLVEHIKKGKTIDESNDIVHFAVDRGILQFESTKTSVIASFVCPLICTFILEHIFSTELSFYKLNQHLTKFFPLLQHRHSFGELLKGFIEHINIASISTGSKKNQRLNSTQSQANTDGTLPIGSLSMLPTVACYHFELYAFLKGIINYKKLMLYTEFGKRIDLYTSIGTHYGIELASGSSQDKFSTYIARINDYATKCGDQYGIFVFFTTIPQHLWSSHFSVGQDTSYPKVDKYIIWHQPDFTEFKIYGGANPNGVSVTPTNFTPMLRSKIMTSVNSALEVTEAKQNKHFIILRKVGQKSGGYKTFIPATLNNLIAIANEKFPNEPVVEIWDDASSITDIDMLIPDAIYYAATERDINNIE